MTMHILQDHPYALSLCPNCPHSFVTMLGSPELDLRLDDGYVPCAPTETAALSASLSQVQDSIDRCDLEITRVESTLRRLRGVKTSLQFTSDKMQSLLSPIRRIPPEILAEIATYTLPSGWFEGYAGGHVWTFTHVCRAWRATALHMRWPWARFYLPRSLRDLGDKAMEIISTYFERSDPYPLNIRLTLNSFYVELGDVLRAHAARIHELEVRTSWSLILPFQFPNLRRLRALDCKMPDSIDAPNLCILELYDTHSPPITLPWENLRALSIHGQAIYPEEVAGLRRCARLEVLSLAAFNRDGEVLKQDDPKETLVFPALITLEICDAAIMLCAYLSAPALRHLILEVSTGTFTVDGGLAEFETEAFGYLYSLVPPITTLTLRDMDDYEYQEPYLRELFAKAPRLRKACVVVMDDAPHGEKISMYTDFFSLLCCGDEHPKLPQLTEVELLERVKSVDWNIERVDLVRRVLQSRGSPSVLGPARLRKLLIHTPFVFPNSAMAEGWANLRGPDGERILDVHMQCEEEGGLVESGIDVAAALGDLNKESDVINSLMEYAQD
ncbi:hypothetical protein EV121DRAFT_297132 [Schizophyllum commune]